MSCGIKEALVFSMGLVSGTATTLTAKVLYGIESYGLAGTPKLFEMPIFQTWAMFFSMIFALPIHWAYQWHVHKKYHAGLLNGTTPPTPLPPSIPMKTYLALAYPAAFDLIGTFFANVGLLYVTVSTFQLMKCTVIIFVATLKVCILKEKIQGYMWMGILFNTIAVLLVGLTSLQEQNSQNENYNNPAFGLFMIILSCAVQACQYVYEETLMSEGAASAPPLIVVGMEGVWGLIFTSFVVYPIAYFIPGNSYGSNERFDDAITMLYNSQTAQAIFIIYILAILGYNVLAVFVTYLLDSIWHAILDNFRPITVWGMDLVLFYLITSQQFGEAWTYWSFLKLSGMFVLLFGTAVYNGTLQLPFCSYEDSWDQESGGIRTPTAMASTVLTRSPLITRQALQAQHILETTTKQGESERLRQEYLAEYHPGSEVQRRKSYGSFSG